MTTRQEICSKCNVKTTYYFGAVTEERQFVCRICAIRSKLLYFISEYYDSEGNLIVPTLQELLTKYAESIVYNREHIQRRTLDDLKTLGYHLAGYVGTPIAYKDNNVVGQIIFNMTKKGTFKKRNPFTIVIKEQDKGE